VAGRYSFGDSDVAARRLALMARVFEPTSRALLAESVPPGAGTALDLGCGPGNTTRLLAEVARPRSTLGLDSSERYVAAARAGTDDPAVSFACHDVTSLPLPGAPADVVYARLLLAHLPDARALAEGWRTQLRPDGVLVLEEVEAIDPPPGVLRDYEDLVAAVVAAGGGDMYAGPLLAPLGGRCLDLDVDAAVAGRMFGLNLATWRDEALAHGLASRAQLHRIAEGLTSLVEAGPGRGTARWVIRQLVVPA
jgi:SAM-dependent methyltransferase